jgi:SAM-dependent methyltransferase
MAAQTAAARQGEHRYVWAAKPALREIYGDLYRRMVAACVPGTTVEIGGGSGNLKQFTPDVVSLDIVHEPWLDLVADAQALPFGNRSIDNIVMFDVLHHVEYPVRFLREAARTLRDGGRLVCMEPGITPVSGMVYRLFHEEPVDMRVDPLRDGKPDANKDPYVGNQAIPSLLVRDGGKRLSACVPELTLVERHWLSLFAYPLSGGFKRWTLVSGGMARHLLAAERRLESWLGPISAFRLMLILQKKG